MKVLKFGGSSVASEESIRQVAAIIKDAAGAGQLVVVVSALGGVTDDLEQVAQEAALGNEAYLDKLEQIEKRHLNVVRALIPIQHQSRVVTTIKMWLNQLDDVCRGVFLIREISPKTMDFIYSFGERLSACILSEYLIHSGLEAQYQDAREVIKTDRRFGKAVVQIEETVRNIQQVVARDEKIFILPGFIASTRNNETTTLGRGGSDYSASLIAHAVQAETLEIWTDVEGVFTADPRIVKEAKPVKNLTYEEAMELAHFGASVIYPPTMQPVMERHIPIIIKNTFKPEQKGTRIADTVEGGASVVRGITGLDNVAMLTLSGSSMVGVPGVAARLFKALADDDINIILITQASSEHTITVGFGEADVSKARAAVSTEFDHEITLHHINAPVIEESLSVISVVGDGMKMKPGIAGRFFSTLGEAGINIHAIAQGSSERNISIVVQTADKSRAIQTLHTTFF